MPYNTVIPGKAVSHNFSQSPDVSGFDKTSDPIRVSGSYMSPEQIARRQALLNAFRQPRNQTCGTQSNALSGIADVVRAYGAARGQRKLDDRVEENQRIDQEDTNRLIYNTSEAGQREQKSALVDALKNAPNDALMEPVNPPTYRSPLVRALALNYQLNKNLARANPDLPQGYRMNNGRAERIPGLPQLVNALRKTIKGADDYNYYQDTGERVLPNVQATPKQQNPPSGYQWQGNNHLAPIAGGPATNQYPLSPTRQDIERVGSLIDSNPDLNGMENPDEFAFAVSSRAREFMKQNKTGSYEATQQALEELKGKVTPGEETTSMFGWNLNPFNDTAPRFDSTLTTGNQSQQGAQEGATAKNPQTGERIIFKGGQWQPIQ